MDNEKVDNVVICAGEAVHPARKAMGWDVESLPDMGKCEVYVNPMPQIINRLLEVRQEDSVHLFSGIRGFEFVFKAFEASLRYNLKRGLITERPNTFAFNLANGKPLWMHRIRFFLEDRKFVPYISYVFAMGEDAVAYYKSLSKKWKVFPFAYCTSTGFSAADDVKLADVLPDIKENAVQKTEKAKFVFVGSLSWRKAPKDILKALYMIKKEGCSFSCGVNFAGGGKILCELEDYINEKNLSGIELMGNVPHSQILQIIRSADILILPSLYDGWGAVVNEALSEGLYVISSDKCGAKELLCDRRIGRVFKAGHCNQLKEAMLYAMQHIAGIRQNRIFRKNWAEKHISGKAIADYLVKCVTGETDKAPWMQ